MIGRLQFYMRVRKRDRCFVHNAITSEGLAIESYSILSDRVRLRRSKFGYVIGYSDVSRTEAIRRMSEFTR